MKRILAALFALSTALTLSMGAAQAQLVSNNPLLSSKGNKEVRQETMTWQVKNPTSNTLKKDPTSSVTVSESLTEPVNEHSSDETYESSKQTGWDIAKSSFEEDFANNDPFGTKLDQYVILAGAIGLGTILYSLAIAAGMQLPHVTAN